MFWDRVSGVYDLFGYIYNGKVNRIMCRVIRDHINETDDVLECACGTGMISAEIAGKCRSLKATDFSKGMIKQAERKLRKYPNVSVESADITHLSYPDESFDRVIAANVIHLLDDPAQALSELFRVCRKGGMVIIPTYVNHENTGKVNAVTETIGKAGADFQQQFTFSNYRNFFEQAGYRVTEIHSIPGRVPCAIAVIIKE